MCTAQRLMQNARSHSLIFNRSIQVCEFAMAPHQEQKRHHFGAVAINVRRMFHHGSTAKTRASRLDWTSAGLPHIHGAHSNLRTNPVDPSSPRRKLTHTIIVTVSCILSSTYVCFCPPHAGYKVSVRRTRLNVLVLLTLALAGESPTCCSVLHEGIVHTPRNTRDRNISRWLQT